MIPRDADSEPLPLDQWPRCCRRQYQADASLTIDSLRERGLDPSGRYVPCDSCLPRTLLQHGPGQPPVTPYVPETWTVGLITTDLGPNGTVSP